MKPKAKRPASLAAAHGSALYGERDAMALGEYYVRHVSAMTSEGLHSKAAIAAELAYRDEQIEMLRKRLAIIWADSNYMRLEWFKENGHTECARAIENIRKWSAPNSDSATNH